MVSTALPLWSGHWPFLYTVNNINARKDSMEVEIHSMAWCIPTKCALGHDVIKLKEGIPGKPSPHIKKMHRIWAKKLISFELLPTKPPNLDVREWYELKVFLPALSCSSLRMRGSRQTGEKVVTRGLLCPVDLTTCTTLTTFRTSVRRHYMHFKAAVRNFYAFI